MSLANRTASLNSRRQADLPRLIMITDRERGGDPLRAASRLPAGSAVILRDYGHPDRARLARDLAALCRRQRLILLIAADARLAATVGAAGLHLPEALAHRARAWRRRRPAWLITASAHSLPALWLARRAGADAALVGPVFATASHPDARTLGPLRFAALARLSPLPVYALGGIDATTARRLKAAGAQGFAAIGAFAGA
jgi:thiamine-phosphate pyrophosphorylase